MFQKNNQILNFFRAQNLMYYFFLGVAAGLGALDSVYLVDKESCCQGLCKKGGEGCCH